MYISSTLALHTALLCTLQFCVCHLPLPPTLLSSLTIPTLLTISSFTILFFTFNVLSQYFPSLTISSFTIPYLTNYNFLHFPFPYLLYLPSPFHPSLTISSFTFPALTYYVFLHHPIPHLLYLPSPSHPSLTISSFTFSSLISYIFLYSIPSLTYYIYLLSLHLFPY